MLFKNVIFVVAVVFCWMCATYEEPFKAESNDRVSSDNNDITIESPIDSEIDTLSVSDADVDVDTDSDVDMDSDVDINDVDANRDVDASDEVDAINYENELAVATDAELYDGSLDSETKSENEAERVVLQEEEIGFCHMDGRIETEHSGFSGIGYVNTQNRSGSGIIWRVEAMSKGAYGIELVYALAATEERSGRFVLNEKNTQTDILFKNTGSWESWSSILFDVELIKGVNTFSLYATDSHGLPNIDCLIIDGANISPTECSIRNVLEGEK